MSEDPPRTTTDCGWPKASFIVRSRGAGRGRTRGRPSGSTRRQTPSKFAQPGVHRRGAARVAGARPWPGRRVHRPAATSSSRRSRRPGRAGGPMGKSRARVHPSCAKESGPGVPGPNRLSTARNDGSARGRDRRHRRLRRHHPLGVGRRTGTARTRPARRAGSSVPPRRAGGRRMPRGRSACRTGDGPGTRPR